MDLMNCTGRRDSLVTALAIRSVTTLFSGFENLSPFGKGYRHGKALKVLNTPRIPVRPPIRLSDGNRVSGNGLE